VICGKELSQEYFDDWTNRMKKVDFLTSNKEIEKKKLYNELESNLNVYGATAIEDKRNLFINF
jgi:hypothetical protein